MGKIQVFHRRENNFLHTLLLTHRGIYILNHFRCLIEAALKELEKKRIEYEKSPEKHPLYPDEWKIFWNRRYKELQAGLHFLHIAYRTTDRAKSLILLDKNC